MPTILHIEDDPANRLLVRKLLAVEGFEVVDAVDGLDGIRKARQTRPDLVLVDIAIPGLDGYEVTLRLRAEPELRDVPIVAITAEGSRDASLAVGCNGFLQKPIDARSFACDVKSYLKGQRDASSRDGTDQHLRAQSQRIAGHLEEKIAELLAANERLLELDHARKEFYRNISHELATPMTPIVGYLKLLLDDELGPLAPPQRKALGAMEDCVQRLRALIDNLLDVTGLETGRMRFVCQEYDLASLARKALARKSSSIERARCHVVTDLPKRLDGLGDADRLRRAIEHLLDNAVKFTPPGGVIGLRVRSLRDGRAEVCVADSGPGVPQDKAEQLFQAFYQVDGSPTRVHGGAGVGLAIVRGIMQGHGGDVLVESPSQAVIGGERLTGAAFYLLFAQRLQISSG
ncbi:ATP-binding protein [Myxococcota bacterium]